MRAAGGLLLFHALLLCVGIAFLYATGLVELRASRLVAALGAAHLAGIALTCLALVVLLVLGGSAGPAVFVIVSVVLAAGLAAAGRLGPARPPRAPTGALAPVRPGPIAVVLAGAIGLFLLTQARAARGTGTAWDAAHNWSFKAV